MLLGELATMLEASPAFGADACADAREAVSDAARREARLIACGVLDCAPGELSMRLDRPVPHTQADRMRAAAARRARGEPLAYCVGSAAFRHLVLSVDARVLIPRPETEIVVDEALRLAGERGGIAVDIGTGSGAIALALASEGRFDLVIATDISEDALDVARLNALALPKGSAPVEFRSGADTVPLRGIVAGVIVSNPPYISYDEAHALPPGVRNWEPWSALFASDRGMARYDALLAGAPEHLEPGGWLVLEVDSRRAGETHDRATRAGYTNVRVVQDLTGRDRVLVAQWPEAR